MIERFVDVVSAVQAALFEHAVLPIVYALGLAPFTEFAFDATEWFLLGTIEVMLLWILLAPLERWWPAQAIADRRAVLTDVLYTLFHRLGLFALLMFALVQPVADEIEGALRFVGFDGLALDAWWPGVSDRPWVSFLTYLVAFDFVDYWMHRAQHSARWWWALHSLHHSQRDMTLWSDNRNHLLDDMLRDAVFALMAVAFGLPPSQFVMLVLAARAIQSLQHTNVRLHFGPFEKLIVSPRFHRRHHAIGIGHEGRAGTPKRWGVNFAVLFPIWDMVFRTADFSPGYEPTGVRDQLPGQWPADPRGRDYGHGFWAQQWLGMKRLLGRA